MNNDKGIVITNEVKQDGRAALGKQISDIKEARANVQEQNSILNTNIESLAGNGKSELLGKEVDNLTKLIHELNAAVSTNLKSKNEEIKANAENVKALIASTNINKDAKKALEQFGRASANYKKAMDDGTASFEKAFEIEEDFSELHDTVPALIKAVKNIKDHINDCSDAVEKQTTAIVNNKNARVREDKESINKRKEQHKTDVNTGGQSLPKAYREEIGKLNSELRSLVNTLNINKLANELAPSSRQKIQQDLQTNYNLTSSEFESFKKDLYRQIDTSLYTDDEIKAAMQTLNTTALGSTKTATKYFGDIIKGQKVLGMSMETQQNLLKLGNITGRNELTFYQNQVAKYLNSSLGLNKKQLDELVSLNTNLQMQAADIGIATEAFENMSMNEQAAFEATATGGSAKYTQALSSLLANTDTASALLGMSPGQLSERLARGESFIDILRNGMGSREAINVLQNGTAQQQTEMYEYAKSAWGVDNNTWSLLRIIAQQGSELNRNLSTATDAATEDGQEALKSLEEKEFDALTGIQQTVNALQNYFESEFSWKLLSQLGNISVLLTALLSVVSITSSLKELTGGGVSKLLGKAAGTKIGGKLLTSAGGKVALTGLGKGLIGGSLLAGGLAMGGIDAVKTLNYSDNQIVGGARGFFMGTGYKNQSTTDKVGSILGNGAKGALIGAGIGTMLGGPLIGTAIGGLAGLVLGGIGTMLDKKGEKELTAEEKRAKREEEYLDAIKQNTYNTAMNTAKSGIGVVYRYRGTSNYSSMSGGIGGPAGGNYSVTSNYGPRKSFKTDNGAWTSSFHSGTDFGAPEGTPLYSNVTGTVLAAGKDNAGANYVGVTDEKTGYTHWYWHMMKPASVQEGQRVRKGELVGYVGHTGNAKGDHLHYTVTKPGRKDWWNAQESTVDPLPFATSSIFEGGLDSSTTGTDSLINPSIGISTVKSTKLHSTDIGDSAPVVDSINDLKNTIIKLSEQTSRNQKIMDALVKRTMQSPTI